MIFLKITIFTALLITNSQTGITESDSIISLNYTNDVSYATETFLPIDTLDYDKISETYPSFPLNNSQNLGYNNSNSWWFKRNSEKLPPSAQSEIALLDYNAYYLGDTSQKVIYLTFDEGYEKGYTSQILDVLKENKVPAAFFLTKDYIKTEPELSKRMSEEGHVVANHTASHPKMSTLEDEEIFNELEECANYYYEITGFEMSPFFRPPEGEYSIRTLEKTKEAGYSTIFWSFAYQDWIVDNQPGEDVAYDMVMKYSHSGCIMLLHAVSESNTLALDKIIKDLKSQGYEFKSLWELPDAQMLKEALEKQ